MKRSPHLPSPLALLTTLILLLCGCRGVPEYKSDYEAKAAYQQIANLLPELTLGVAEPPGIVRMTRNTKIPVAPKDEDLSVSANEKRFKLRVNTLIPRVYEVPYEAIEDIDFVYQYFPNVLYCFIMPFLQSWRTRIVIDTKFVPKLREDIISDIKILRAVSSEISLPQPYYYAEELERRLLATEAEWGKNRIVLIIGRSRICPPFIPYAGSNKDVAELFLWAREQVLNTKDQSK
jgi:hypothetical protein